MFITPRTLLSLLGLIVLPSLGRADTLFVDADLMTGLGDGSTWADAFQGSNGLQDALAASVSGDDIFVKAGTYLPTDTASRTVAFNLKSGVAVYGSFAGTEASPEERPAFGTPTSILLGDLAGDDGSNMFGDNSFHVVNGAGTDATAVLDGFLVTGGNANGATGSDRGAGIICTSGSSPTVRKCHFVNNRCTFGGGAGYINGSAPSFTDCTFDGNMGGAFGGAFDMAGAGNVRFDRCVFTNNLAARAGALEIFASSGVIVSNSVFQGNTATGGGGGGAIWTGNGGNTQVRNCTVVDNFSNINEVAGIRNQGAFTTVANCIVVDNSGPGGAQASANQVTTGMTVTYSLIEGGAAGMGNVSGDPLFADSASGDFALLAMSPAIDAADNTAVPSGITLDFAQNPRFADELTVTNTGVGPSPIADMGAFERQENACVVSSENYCTANANSSGATTSVAISGSLSVAENSFALNATGAIANGAGLFYYGGGQANLPFGDGVRCVSGQTFRLNPPVFSNFFGDADRAIDFTLPPFNSGPGAILGGDTWNFQYWYRDVNGASGFNLSDGISVTFCP